MACCPGYTVGKALYLATPAAGFLSTTAQHQQAGAAALQAAHGKQQVLVAGMGTGTPLPLVGQHLGSEHSALTCALADIAPAALGARS